MLYDLLPFQIHLNATVLSGIGLWALALYLGLFPVSEWVAVQLSRWFNVAERSLYTSQEEFDRTRTARESQNAFYASLLSIVPFLCVGVLCNYGMETTLGQSWSISVGIIACIGCGIYELGRRSTQSPD